eukprot:gnl/MRDRNA2_/MRDRNA2_94822_c0_seq1.p1 gnl/MRDRNA2_/MRDRNA2_94822_c0~~gnl/MRDRNA2_/MRDRNA2_94822_c0_seq1.p1  ORF type:complete len:342 (-),score=46.90 gnl/MRDRNA2_/MRDRNA2_94822_c0_seq1:13-1038(-)
MLLPSLRGIGVLFVMLAMAHGNSFEKGNVCDMGQKGHCLLQNRLSMQKTGLQQRVDLKFEGRDNSIQSLSADLAVPKIVHFMFKTDLSQQGQKWPNAVWKASYDAWKKYFPEPEYEYRFWTDTTIDLQFKEHCPQHYALYSSFKDPTMRSDMSRYCLLQEFGGIYSDLDYEPRANFYGDLKPGKISLIESQYPAEEFQNSLMASPKGAEFAKFWAGLLDNVESTHHQNPNEMFPPAVTGPVQVDKFVNFTGKALVNELACREYHKPIQSVKTKKKSCGVLAIHDQDTLKGIHWSTLSWASPDLSFGTGEFGAGAVNNGLVPEAFAFFHPEYNHNGSRDSSV